ncbi:hypothetical protein GH714_034673 [Hevea brasiliensis]|uniref:DUF4371 domain-containing protein n=1 Tax=Hevea brasiliensis TaxID=3981 RepID=A0A6A6M2X7_HEVBR|nr:hypothetical protein GH714_034673 [Hevea brasiliensis]
MLLSEGLAAKGKKKILKKVNNPRPTIPTLMLYGSQPTRGFHTWKKVNDGKNCAFLCHVGKDPNSLHKVAVKKSRDLMNQNQHIEKVIEKQSCQQIENNCLRLKVSCDAIKWWTFQACALRGHDESSNSKNRGKFIELIKLLSSYNDKVESVVLENAPQNASYISPKVQKEILHVISNKVRDAVRDEIGDGKFCIIVDKASDESRKELQLALVAASREIIEVEKLIANHELETGKGLNQVGTIERASDTRWSSHLSSVRSLVIMFEVTCSVLKTIIVETATYNQRGDADYAYNVITSFEFVFILHLMKEILEITDDLCQALQYKSQDILNAMSLVSTTKMLIQKMRESGWDSLLESVKVFCEKHEIDIPNMNAHYNSGRGRTHNQRDPITFEYYFRVDVFIATIDSQLQELNVRFKEDMMELLILSSSLDLRDGFRSFRLTNFAILQISFILKIFQNKKNYI